MTDRPQIRHYMTRDLVSLTPDMEINRAMQVLLDHHISGAPVVDDKGALVGLLSKKDCLRAALHASYFREWGEMVSDYMAKDVQTLRGDMDIVEAATAFISSDFRLFPILSDGRLVGQISRSDILRALAEEWA